MCVCVCVFIGNPFEMRLLNLRINFFISDFCPHLGKFFFVFFHYVSAKFRHCPFSGDQPRSAANRGIESLRFPVSIVRR